MGINTNTESQEDTRDFAWDHSIEQDGEAWFWLAWVENPGMPEPHCYGNNGLHLTGDRAVKLIDHMSKMTPQKQREFANGLLTGENQWLQSIK